MNGHTQEFAAFWQTVAGALNGGRTLVQAIEEGRAKVTQPEALAALERVGREVAAGGALADALAQQPAFFEAAVVVTIRAAETAGHLRAAAAEIARFSGDGGSESSLAEAPAVIAYVADLLRKALAAHASDLQLDPTGGGEGTARMRIDGVLHPVDAPPRGLFQGTIDHLKTLGAMDVSDRRLPQDGSCLAEDYALRIATAPVFHGERACVRLLTRQPQELLFGLDKMGLDDADLTKVRRLAHLRSGLVIVNGPTGCGKTTLLYSMLMEIARPEVNILTVEDPVELALPGVSQMTFRPDVGMTFPRAIRAMMRQAPNVIMVGEIRDLETAELCHSAALTGHLVLTTLHANTCPEAVGRLLDLGIKPWLLSASLGGIISMRLVRKLCPHCRGPAKPETVSLPPGARQLVEANKGTTFYGPAGCDRCRGHGFAGRTGVYEVLTCDDGLRHAIVGGRPELAEAAIASGMRTMFQDGIEKAARGITTVEELLWTIPVQDWR